MRRRARALPLLLLAACAHAHPVKSSSPFVDADGNAVTLAHLPAERIVSTMQSATEWIVALHQSQRLIARTDYDHEPELATLPSIGGGLDPSPEAIVALKPDVVLGWRSRSSADLEHVLAPFHIPVLSFETTDTADAFRDLQEIGVLVGQAARADSLAAALRDGLAGVRRDACGANPPLPETVFIVLWTDPPMTAGRNTWLSTLVQTACLRNVFDDVTSAWPTVSMEAIAARHPDWILTSKGLPGQRLSELRTKPGWRDLQAVRDGHILEIPGDFFARAGPTMANAARAIVAAHRAIAGQ